MNRLSNRQHIQFIGWVCGFCFALLSSCHTPTPAAQLPTLAATSPQLATLLPPTAVPLTTQPATATATLTAVPPTFTPLPSPTAVPTASNTPTPTPCPPGQQQTGTFPSTLAGDSNYLVYLPPCYGQDGRTYPTLYLFAGNSQNETAWANYGLLEAAETLITHGRIPPMLIVMPDGGWIANSTSGGPTSYEGHILDNLLPFIEQTYCAWPQADGRAIGGLSRGGYWSLEIAFRHPHLFRSVGGHSPALIDSHAGPDVNPQYTALSNDLGDLRIYIDIGRNDYLLPNTLKLHEDMAAQNIPHTWLLNEGAHEDSYWPQHLTDYLLWYAQPWPLDRQQYPACP